MNHTHLPKEVILPDLARQDKQGTKGDRVCIPFYPILIRSNTYPSDLRKLKK